MADRWEPKEGPDFDGQAGSGYDDPSDWEADGDWRRESGARDGGWERESDARDEDWVQETDARDEDWEQESGARDGDWRRESGARDGNRRRERAGGREFAGEPRGNGSGTRGRRKNRRRGRKPDRRPVLVAVLFIGIVVLLALGSVVVRKYSPTKERVDLASYYGIVAPDDMAIILDGERLDSLAKFWEGHAYLDYDMVCRYLNKRFYWDANENILRYTTPEDVISASAGSEDYTVTRKNENDGYVIVKADASTAYIALDFIQKYTDLEFSVYEDPYRVKITTKWEPVTTAQLKRKGQIREKGGIKSPIVADLEKDSEVTILEQGEDWSRVLTADGLIGYLQNRRMRDPIEKKPDRAGGGFEEPQFEHLLKNKTVSMGWHQVTTQEANGKVADVLKASKGINVISPTWFYLEGSEGGIHSLASKDYVKFCHKNDIEVWALVSNLEDPDADSTYVLTHTSTRDNLTNQIIAAAIEYDLDGINLDFESLSEEVGDAYIQFVRELSLKCEANRLVLSVDNYVPSSYTEFYNRAEQAVFADYVVIMAYDEHYSGSEDIGPVASIGFAREGVENTKKEVPAEQIILGMPFYSRIWELTMKEGAGEDVESASEGYVPYTFTCFEEGMQTVEDRYKANGATATWSEEDGQFVTEYESEGKTYKIWIENEDSLEEKLKLMKEEGVAGAAYWKLGLERPAAWNKIVKYVN